VRTSVPSCAVRPFAAEHPHGFTILREILMVASCQRKTRSVRWCARSHPHRRSSTHVILAPTVGAQEAFRERNEFRKIMVGGHQTLATTRHTQLGRTPVPPMNNHTTRHSPESRDRAHTRLRRLTQLAAIAATGVTALIGVVVAHERPGSSSAATTGTTLPGATTTTLPPPTSTSTTTPTTQAPSTPGQSSGGNGESATTTPTTVAPTTTTTTTTTEPPTTTTTRPVVTSGGTHR
jgi:hypothetical protein